MGRCRAVPSDLLIGWTDAPPAPTTMTSRTRNHTFRSLMIIGVVMATATAATALRTQSVAPGGVHFEVTRDLQYPMSPGVNRGLNVRLRNPSRYWLAVTDITVTVSVDRAHRAAGCSASRDFLVRQMPKRVYPIVLRPGANTRLRSLGVNLVPRLYMLNLPTVNQNACKGAKLTFHFTATSRATTSRPVQPR